MFYDLSYIIVQYLYYYSKILFSSYLNHTSHYCFSYLTIHFEFLVVTLISFQSLVGQFPFLTSLFIVSQCAFLIYFPLRFIDFQIFQLYYGNHQSFAEVQVQVFCLFCFIFSIFSLFFYIFTYSYILFYFSCSGIIPMNMIFV